MKPVMVIACYRPKPGKEGALVDLMKTHLPILRAEGLVGDGPSLMGRAKDGTIVEVFQWKSQAAIDGAHTNEAVLAMWGEYAEVAGYVPIKDVAGAADLFTALEPISAG